MVRLLVVLLLAQHFEVASDCGGSPAPAVNDAPATQLALGGFHGCTVEAGALRCWGANERGQLGLGTSGGQELRAKAVALDEAVAQVVTGERSTCARTVTGRVWCWGDNAGGQLSAGEPAFSATPIEVSVPVPVASISLDSDYVLALGSDGRLFGWGNDFEGQLAREDARQETSPAVRPVVRSAFDVRFKAIASGQGHACGVDRSNALWCWGRNVRQETGTGSPEHQVKKATRVLENVAAVSAGAFGTCAVRGSELLCWGEMPIDDFGQLLAQPTPTVMSLGGAVPRAVDVMWFHGCATTTDDRLFCWGRGIEGQLGLGATEPSAIPREVTTGVTDVSTGYFSTCLQRASGAIECMGANDTGQLGLGDTSRRSSPTPQ
jgi:alpha-tubulin suppressor-like RCC1 family protein